MANIKHQEKKYWFYLEPYTFVFVGDKQTVIYNTLNSAYIPSSGNKRVDKVIQLLLLQGSGYCTEITDEDMEDKAFSDFIQQIRNSFSGDIVPQKKNKPKPFIFKPILRLIDNFHHIKKQGYADFSLNILRYLKEISLYISSDCNQECQSCSNYYKQTLFCTKQNNHENISLETIIEILDKIEKTGVNLVNITGGNIFDYEHFVPLVSILKDHSFKTRFYIHYKNINDVEQIPTNEVFTFIVLINLESFDKNSFKKSVYLLKEYDVEYLFFIESEDDYILVAQIIKENPKLKINIKPFYNNNNFEFFQQNVFIDLDDIINSNTDKQTIFRRETLNENFFGQLIIGVNGDVYSNINYMPIGNIFKEDTLNKIVFEEINTGRSWFKIRNEGICKGCCNRLLCPSPSNYEIVLNRENLCNITSL